MFLRICECRLSIAIGGVDDAAQLGRVFEECGQLIPMIAPGRNGRRITSFPGLREAVQGQLSSLDGRRCVDRSHTDAQQFAVFLGDELGHVADVMHDAELDIRWRKHGFDGIAQAG